VVAAIFGLIGVVVGGLITGGVDLFLEHRRESRAVATARRLVIDELHNVWSHLDMLKTVGTTPQRLSEETSARFLPTGDWDRYREVLASPSAGMSDDAWIGLSNLITSAKALRLFVLEQPPLASLPAQIDVAGLEQLSAEIYEQFSGRPPEGRDGPRVP
jgi:hypothetical protein